jgi:AraC-like DNA-binding protein
MAYRLFGRMHQTVILLDPDGHAGMQSTPDAHTPDVQRISSGSFPRGHRFSYWADVVAQTFVPLQCDTADRDGFFGELRHRQIGLVGITEVRAAAMIARRTKAKIASAPRDDAIVVLQDAGSCHAGQSAQGAQLQLGDGAIVTADEPYFFDFPSAFRQFVLKLPRRLVADHRIVASRERVLLLSGAGARLLRNLAVCSLEEPSPLSPEQEAGVERAFAELIRAAAYSSANAEEDAKPAPHYAAARRFIRRQLSDPALTPAAVAEHVKMSTRNLARLFARQGTTIDRTIWLERLIAARRDLIDPRLRECSITEVALSWAFSDAAHFSRRFSSAFGTSPATYRAANLSRRSDQGG